MMRWKQNKVDLHLAKHGNLQKSLAQLSSMDGVVQQLHSLASPDIAAILPPVFSEYATVLHLPTVVVLLPSPCFVTATNKGGSDFLVLIS